MKKTISAVAASLALAGTAEAEGIRITPNASIASVIGAPSNFTGRTVIDMLAPATEATGASTALVTFAPGARTTWHTHPAGQMLIVTSGKGWIQEEGQPRRDLNPGDVIWIAAGIKHWHGASATRGMAHIAVSYVRDGKNVDWLEPVREDTYLGG